MLNKRRIFKKNKTLAEDEFVDRVLYDRKCGIHYVPKAPVWSRRFHYWSSCGLRSRAAPDLRREFSNCGTDTATLSPASPSPLTGFSRSTSIFDFCAFVLSVEISRPNSSTLTVLRCPFLFFARVEAARRASALARMTMSGDEWHRQPAVGVKQMAAGEKQRAIAAWASSSKVSSRSIRSC